MTDGHFGRTAGAGFRARFVDCGGREVHCADWGALGLEEHRPLVMWHGLTRNGRDFDEAAGAFCATRRVLCPDAPGRGLSAWLPAGDYRLEVYAEAAARLLDALGVGECDWAGTSMGGLLGMRMAAGVLRGRIRRLVLNDVGPEIPAGALARIAAYAGAPPAFGRVSEFAAWLRAAYAPFGENPDSYWERLARTSHRRLPDGRVTAHYDPAIVSPFARAAGGLDMWAEYDSLECPTLLLRGADSDVLSAMTAMEMTRRGPRARLVVFPGCGHAPTLATPEQIETAREFLEGE